MRSQPFFCLSSDCNDEIAVVEIKYKAENWSDDFSQEI